jgi:hypothetical protein
MAAGVAVAADLGQSGAPDGLERPSAFDRGGIKEKKIVSGSRAPRTEDAEEPLDGLREPSSALVVGMLSGKTGKQVADLPAGRTKEAPIGWKAHEGLGNCEGDDLGIGGAPASDSPSLWQKIIGCAINNGAEGVQVGVHRGLQADDVLNTVGFGPSASKPFFGAMFVASII